MSSRHLPCLLVLALGTTTAHAIDAQSRIDRVTVHPDRAEVTRVAEVRLSAGASVVRFADLPTSIEPDSLRVSGRGTSASIGAVELRQEVRAVVPSPDLAVAQAEVAKLQLELARLTSEEATDAELRKYLQSLQESTARNPPAGSPATATDTAALQRMFAFLREAQ